MKHLKPEFVEFIPKKLEDEVIYISMRFRTAVHKCACGCGNKTVTRFSPSDWKMTFDGRTISLQPSIGNWSFPCQSHYWIKRNRILWAEHWDADKINQARSKDKINKSKPPIDEMTTQPEKKTGRKRWPWLYDMLSWGKKL